MADGQRLRPAEDGSRARPNQSPPMKEQQAMTRHIRSILAISILAVVLAACGATVADLRLAVTERAGRTIGRAVNGADG